MKKFKTYIFKDSGEAITAYDGLDAMRVFSSFGVVFLHVCASTGVPGSLELFLRFRDFSLPVLVMSSFFLLTVSLKKKSDATFGQFFSRRFSRIWLPFFIWTLIYVLFSDLALPLMIGKSPSDGSYLPLIFLSGYRHLWYLQFVFLGSLVFFPFICLILRNFSLSRASVFSVCLLSSVLYWNLYYFVFNRGSSRQSLGAAADINLQIFADQASFYIVFIPAAIGLGMISDKLDRMFRRAPAKTITLIGALAAMALHVAETPLAATREIYGAAVFLAALLPWKKIDSPIWQKLIAYSYGIYILHFFGAQVLFLVLSGLDLEPGGMMVICAALLIYFLSFSVAVMIKRILPFDWLLPLVRDSGSDRVFDYPVLRLDLADKK